jgi:hypothetical protein
MGDLSTATWIVRRPARAAAPAAGAPPYEPYQITPTVVCGLGTADSIGPRHTSWRFTEKGLNLAHVHVLREPREQVGVADQNWNLLAARKF